MPRIKGITGPFRFFFMSFDCAEPSHVHVKREDKACKFWLNPLVLGRNQGFNSHELSVIRGLIRRHLGAILGAWYEHSGE